MFKKPSSYKNCQSTEVKFKQFCSEKNMSVLRNPPHLKKSLYIGDDYDMENINLNRPNDVNNENNTNDNLNDDLNDYLDENEIIDNYDINNNDNGNDNDDNDYLINRQPKVIYYNLNDVTDYDNLTDIEREKMVYGIPLKKERNNSLIYNTISYISELFKNFGFN